MRVVVTGATGNVGTAVLRALDADSDVDQVVAVARRPPIRSLSPAEFFSADISADRLEPIFAGPTPTYSRHKAAVEGDLDRLGAEHPRLRIVRMRPGLIFQRSAATEIRRLFIGPLLPGALLRSSLAPISPDVPGLRFQAVHSDDVADAYRRAVLSDVSGPFNVAADPVIDAAELPRLLDARPVRIPARIVRAAADTTFALRLQPADPGWVDMALGAPLMSVERATSELGWSPRHTSLQAIGELVVGLRDGAEDQTAPLARGTSGPARARELLTGMGQRQ